MRSFLGWRFEWYSGFSETRQKAEKENFHR